MKTHITGWKVPAIAWLPISAAIVAETVSNGLRAYGLGTHLEKFTITAYGASVSLAGAVLVLAAVAVSLSQARAAWLALMPGPVRQRIVAAPVALLLLAVSITAMATHILEAERAKAGAEIGQSGNYQRDLESYTAIKAELDGLQKIRPIEAIKADLDAAPVPRNVFRRTKECTDITQDESLAACRPVSTLRQEMGQALRKRELEPQLAALKLALAGQTKPEVASAAEALVSWYWAWIMGVAVVFIATFGAVIWAKPTSATSANVNASKENLVGTEVAPVAAITQQVGSGLADNGQSDFDANGEDVDPRWFGDGPKGPKPGTRKSKPKKKDKTIEQIRAQTMAGKRPSLKLVQSRYRLPKTTAHRYLKQALVN
jgi:membrane protein implicated in regulation of membrane protease activity